MSRRRHTSLLLCLIAALSARHASAATAPSADEVRRGTGVANGLAVVLGGDRGLLEAGLAEVGTFLVQGLTTDGAACARARAHLFAQGVYGQAAVDHVASLRALPFYDRLVNLLVADLDALGADAPGEDEILRVLGFEGAAWLRRRGVWGKLVRPLPPEVDVFTHYHRDATRSNMSRDRLTGPPNALRWTGQPADHNGYMSCLVGHGITFVRSGSGAGNKSGRDSVDLPKIVFAKDASSGVTLWARDTTMGVGLPRSIEWGALGRRLYVYTCGITAKNRLEHAAGEYAIEGWNIRTGATELRIPIGNSRTNDKRERDFQRDYFGNGACLAAADGRFLYHLGQRLIVRDEASTDVLWEKSFPDGQSVVRFIVADGIVVAYLRGYEEVKRPIPGSEGPFTALIAWSLADGRELWRHDGPALWAGTPFQPKGSPHLLDLTGYANGLLPIVVWDMDQSERDFSRNALVALLEVKTGKRRWGSVCTSMTPRGGGSTVVDHYIRGDRLYIARMTSIMTSFDLATGAEDGEARWRNSPRMSNCCSGTATARYLVLQRNYIPWDAIEAYRTEHTGKLPDLYHTRLISFACRSKITPAYGTSFMMDGSCNCSPFLPGSMALYGIPETAEIADDTRRTAAYPGTLPGGLARQERALASSVALDWKLRPGRTAMTWGAPRITPNERAKGSTEVWGYGRETTDPLRIGDLDIVGHVNEHRVEATRAGKPIWNFIAGGRIAYRGPLQADDRRVYFASHDGHVYAVNHADGTLAWRVHCAPADRRMVAFGQVESSWPLFNVVLHQGRLFGCAGRHQELDGGLHLYAIEAASGKIAWHMRRRFGMADRTHEGATEGALQGRSADWGPSATDKRMSALWAMNGPVGIKGGKLAVIPEAQDCLTVPLDGGEDVIVNRHNLTPPEARAP